MSSMAWRSSGLGNERLPAAGRQSRSSVKAFRSRPRSSAGQQQRISNPQVAGSSPAGDATSLWRLAKPCAAVLRATRPEAAVTPLTKRIARTSTAP